MELKGIMQDLEDLVGDRMQVWPGAVACCAAVAAGGAPLPTLPNTSAVP